MRRAAAAAHCVIKLRNLIEKSEPSKCRPRGRPAGSWGPGLGLTLVFAACKRAAARQPLAVSPRARPGSSRRGPDARPRHSILHPPGGG